MGMSRAYLSRNLRLARTAGRPGLASGGDGGKAIWRLAGFHGYAPVPRLRSGFTTSSGHSESSAAPSSPPPTRTDQTLRANQNALNDLILQARRNADQKADLELGGRQQPWQKWNDLTSGEKVVRSATQTTNFAVILAAFSLLGAVSYALYAEMISSSGSTVIYNDALDRVLENKEVQRVFGIAAKGESSPRQLKGYGESSSNRMRRNRRILAQEVFEESTGRNHLLLRFNIESSTRSFWRYFGTENDPADLVQGQVYADLVRCDEDSEQDIEKKRDSLGLNRDSVHAPFLGSWTAWTTSLFSSASQDDSVDTRHSGRPGTWRYRYLVVDLAADPVHGQQRPQRLYIEWEGKYNTAATSQKSMSNLSRNFWNGLFGIFGRTTEAPPAFAARRTQGDTARDRRDEMMDQGPHFKIVKS